MSRHQKISSRYEGVEGGLFSKVTKADVGDNFASMGEDKITLMGWADPFYPDPSVPEHVKEAAVKALAGGFPSHYIMPIGSLELREEIAKKVRSFNKLDVDPRRNIIITPGSDSGLYYAFTMFVEEGDEVLVPDPSYPNNFTNPKFLGGKAVPVPLNKKNGYHLDIEAFERAVTEKTKAVAITHPNNPTTTVFDREELTKLSEFIIKHDLVLIVDQAFEDCVFDDREFVSPASLPGMWERTITVCSVSKGLGLSGFRIGYLIACDEIMDVLYGAAVSVIGTSNTLAQMTALEAFRHPEYVEKYKETHEYRRKEAYRILNSVDNVHMLLPESGFYGWLDISELGDSTEIMEYLIKEAKVAVNDGKSYGSQGADGLRIIYGCLRSNEEAMNALERIAEALRKYPGKK